MSFQNDGANLKVMVDGFTSHNGGDCMYTVTHNHGTTSVFAPNEAVALARFTAKYPSYQVYDVKKSFR